MRRLASLSTLIAVLATSLAIAGGPSTLAQEGTPPAGFSFEIAPGVTVEDAPAPADAPATYRIRFAPGVVYPFAGDPALGLVLVETGTITLRVDAPVAVARGGAADATEIVAADTEFTVGAGDYFVFAPFAAGELRNDGADEAVASVAGILTEGMATPAAGTATP